MYRRSWFGVPKRNESSNCKKDFEYNGVSKCKEVPEYIDLKCNEGLECKEVPICNEGPKCKEILNNQGTKYNEFSNCYEGPENSPNRFRVPNI